MSKIAEQKALEAYPEDYVYVKCDNEDTNYTEIDDEGTKWLKVDSNKEFRDVYTKCYDQAMQDFLEKAEEWLSENSYKYIWYDEFYHRKGMSDEFIDDFKNYMQDESENKTYSTNYRCRMGYSWMDLG